MITGIFLSLNNHGWGNKPDADGDKDEKKGGSQQEQGPPDLEELWNNFNRKVGSMFGRRGGGGGGGNNNEEPSQFPKINLRHYGGGAGLLAVLVLVLWFCSGFYIVDASQRGVVLQFGAYHETTEPGLRWRLPSPIQSHEVINLNSVRTVEIGYRGSEKNKVLKESVMLTDDENIINIQIAVQYQLNDPKKYLFNNRNVDEAVMQAAETAIREVVGKSKMDFVLYEGRAEIAARTQKLVQDMLDRYETGVQIRSVTMQGTQPPEQVQAAFDDAVKAGQDRERQKNEGQAYANDVIPRARGAASRLMEEANGYRSRMIATAEGDASRFKQILAEYSKAPEVTRTRMYLDTLQQVYSNSSKVMVDAKGQGNLLYLPLDKLMAVTAQPAPAAASASATTPAVTEPAVTVKSLAKSPASEGAVPPQLEKAPHVEGATEVRGRDTLRSRERGER